MNHRFRSIKSWKEGDTYNHYFIHNFGVLDATQIVSLTRYKVKICITSTTGRAGFVRTVMIFSH